MTSLEEMKSKMQANFVDYHVDSEIAKFYENRCIFITGATGFVGKAIAEKLVRSCKNIKRIYLLIRDKRNKVANDRLADLLQSQIFNRIRSQPGGLELLREKIHAISGDITLPNFGISPEDMDVLSRDVNIIINSAASVRFVEPIHVAVTNNVYSVGQLMAVSDQLEHLEAVIHVSTAYSNCDKEVIEEVFYDAPISGDRILKLVDDLERLKELSYEIIADNVTPLKFESNIAKYSSQNLVTELSHHPKIVKKLNFIEIYTDELLESGHRPNTYTLTKAVSESFLLELAKRKPDRYLHDKIPVCVVRPSIIIGAWREPEVGFVDTFSGPTKANLDMALGTLHAVMGTGWMRSDLVPIDMVANMIIATGWYLIEDDSRLYSLSDVDYQSDNGDDYGVRRDQGGYMFNMISGNRNPTTWGAITHSVHELAYNFPSKYLVRLPTGCLIRAGWRYNIYNLFMQTIPAHILDFIQVYVEGKELTKRNSIVFNHQRNIQMLETMVPFTSNQWDFFDNNTRALYDKMTSIDKEIFPFDVEKIDWHSHLNNFNMYARIMLLKDEPLDKKSISIGKKKLKTRQQLYNITLVLLLILFCWILTAKIL